MRNKQKMLQTSNLEFKESFFKKVKKFFLCRRISNIFKHNTQSIDLVRLSLEINSNNICFQSLLY